MTCINICHCINSSSLCTRAQRRVVSTNKEKSSNRIEHKNNSQSPVSNYNIRETSKLITTLRKVSKTFFFGYFIDKNRRTVHVYPSKVTGSSHRPWRCVATPEEKEKIYNSTTVQAGGALVAARPPSRQPCTAADYIYSRLITRNFRQLLRCTRVDQLDTNSLQNESRTGSRRPPPVCSIV